MAQIKLYTNPAYDEKSKSWVMWRDMYEGKHDVMVLPDYLWRHSIEKQSNKSAETLLKNRCERTRYFNMIEILVSMLTSMMFKDEPQLDPAAESLLKEHIDDIDNAGTSLTRFIKDYAARNYMLYGKSIILVDKTRAPEGSIQTLQQYRAAGIRPSFEVINPIDFKDWDSEMSDPQRRGMFNGCRYEYKFNPARNSMEQKPETELRCAGYRMEGNQCLIDTYRAVKEQQAPQQAEIRWERIGETVSTGLDVVPVVVAEDESWIRDAAEECLRYHNLRSTKDNIQFNQGYARLFVITSQADAAQRDMSEYVVNILPDGSNVISVAPVDVAGYDAALSESLSLMFKLGLNQMRAISDSSRQVAGADTIDAQRENTSELVESCLDDIETQINQAIEIWAKWEGKQAGKVQLSRDIGKATVEEWLAIYQAFKPEFDRVPTLRKEALKKAAAKLDLSEESQVIVNAEIDKLPAVVSPTVGQGAFDIASVMNG